MKVLHATNVAGVASLLVQGLRRTGIEADLMVRKPSRVRFLHETVLDAPWPVFWLRILKKSQGYDVLHIHSLAYWISFNIHIFALKTSRAKLVVHLHGTELRSSHNRMPTKVALQICDRVLVSTPDLLSLYPKAVWLPNPIDPVFKPLKNPQRRGKALYFRKWYEPEMEKIVQMNCEDMGLELTIQGKLIPYSEMPNFLNQFEVLFDRFSISSLSKTALEALACGCKVIGWNGMITDRERILETHNLENVAGKLLKIYREILFSGN